MIRIARGSEPQALVEARNVHLANAIRSWNEHGAVDSRLLEGYAVAKPDLFAMQHRKCCYCEKLEEQAKYRDVEHYRPKAMYWWLAWTWENLLFACVDCNREHKRDQFPLEIGSTPLPFPNSPPGGEAPLIIDPTDASTEPTDEIEFRRDRVEGRERWKPYGLTPRGRCTIAVCGLDRPALLDLYTDHVVNVVRPKLAPFFTAHDADDPRGAYQAWRSASRSLLNPARPFRALAHDAMKVLVDEPVRERYGVSLSYPGP